MKKERLIIQVEPEVKEKLRERAAQASILNKCSVSIAEIVRQAIDEYMEKEV